MNVKQVAVGTQEMPVRTNLTAEEREELRDKYITDQIGLTRIQEELDGIKATYKEKIDPIRREQGVRLSLINKGYRDEEKTCYLVPDQEVGEMLYLLETGEEVQRRKLRPEERQLNILSINNTGTNGK